MGKRCASIEVGLLFLRKVTMGKLRTPEQKTAHKKARASKPVKGPAQATKPFKLKIKYTKLKQTLTAKDGAQTINENEVARSKSKVIEAMRKTQPVTNEFCNNLTKLGAAERVLYDGSTERLEMVEEIRELELGSPVQTKVQVPEAVQNSGESVVTTGYMSTEEPKSGAE